MARNLLMSSRTITFNPFSFHSLLLGNHFFTRFRCSFGVCISVFLFLKSLFPLLTEAIINLETVNPIEFFGVNNSKFDLLKRRFPRLKILSRGSQVKLSGQSADVESAQMRIGQIVKYLERNGHLSENYFAQILGDEESGDAPVNAEGLQGDVLVFGPNGKVIRAKTQNQRLMAESAEKNDILFAIGPAGTGKTYTAVALAVRALKNKSVRKIILTRPAVEAGESLGFLPGDLKEKIDPYLRPLYDALDDMLPSDKLNYYMTNRVIEIAPLAYMRGRTLDNAFIILDEAQNATDLQVKMFLTRIGPSAKAIITGDLTQIDLPKNQKSGLAKAVRILRNIEGISHIELDESDVVRHRLVRQIIRAYDKAQDAEELTGAIRSEERDYRELRKSGAANQSRPVESAPVPAPKKRNPPPPPATPMAPDTDA